MTGRKRSISFKGPGRYSRRRNDGKEKRHLSKQEMPAFLFPERHRVLQRKQKEKNMPEYLQFVSHIIILYLPDLQNQMARLYASNQHYLPVVK
jgi:hypothetical protein